MSDIAEFNGGSDNAGNRFQLGLALLRNWLLD
jgi:hypothetical protein